MTNEHKVPTLESLAARASAVGLVMPEDALSDVKAAIGFAEEDGFEGDAAILEVEKSIQGAEDYVATLKSMGIEYEIVENPDYRGNR